MVEVIGATITVCNRSITSGLVSTNTGRGLSGALNRYIQISPRLTVRATRPLRSTLRVRDLARPSLHSRVDMPRQSPASYAGEGTGPPPVETPPSVPAASLQRRHRAARASGHRQ